MRCPRDPPARPLPGTLNEIETRRDMLLIPSYHPCIPHTKPKCPTHARAHGRLEHVPRLPVNRHRGEPGHTHGTHKRTRGHTDHTDEPHNHPNPTSNDDRYSSEQCPPVSLNRYCEGMFSCATPHTRGNAQGEGAMPRDHVGMRRCVCSSDSCAPEKRKCKEVLSWNPRVPARRRAREKCCRR